MADTVTQLQQLGFGEYEAKAYVALLRRNPLNGYELARESGLPRANVYGVLQKLEERGAVVRLTTESGERFSPVPPGELTQRLGSRFEQTLTRARHSLEEITVPSEREYVWNVQGYSALLDHARSLIDGAQDHVLVAIWPEEARELASNLASAEERRVEITTLCMRACPAECGNCQGSIFRCRTEPEQSSRWLMVAPDDREVLAGEVPPGSESDVLAVRTHQPIIVELANSYIRQSVALSTLLADLGDRLNGLLSPHTLSVLSSLGPKGLHNGFLEHWREILALSQVQ